MVHTHLTYVPEISYYYNSNTGLNNHKTKKEEQLNNVDKVRAKKPYKALETLFTKDE